MNAEDLKCPICLDTYENPRTLPCGHNFCGPPRDCVRVLESEGRIQCGVDRKYFNLTVDNLSPNILLREAVAALQASSDQSKEQFITCESNGKKSELVCMDCEEKFICTQCFKDHRTHHIVALDEWEALKLRDKIPHEQTEIEKELLNSEKDKNRDTLALDIIRSISTKLEDRINASDRRMSYLEDRKEQIDKIQHLMLSDSYQSGNLEVITFLRSDVSSSNKVNADDDFRAEFELIGQICGLPIFPSLQEEESAVNSAQESHFAFTRVIKLDSIRRKDERILSVTSARNSVFIASASSKQDISVFQYQLKEQRINEMHKLIYVFEKHMNSSNRITLSASETQKGNIVLYFCIQTKTTSGWACKVFSTYYRGLEISLTSSEPIKMSAWSNFLALTNESQIRIYRDFKFNGTFEQSNCQAISINSSHIAVLQTLSSIRQESGSMGHIYKIFKWKNGDQALPKLEMCFQRRDCAGLSITDDYAFTFDQQSKKYLLITFDGKVLELQSDIYVFPHTILQGNIAVGWETEKQLAITLICTSQYSDQPRA